MPAKRQFLHKLLRGDDEAGIRWFAKQSNVA
jgi:hypothetical protein